MQWSLLAIHFHHSFKFVMVAAAEGEELNLTNLKRKVKMLILGTDYIILDAFQEWNGKEVASGNCCGKEVVEERKKRQRQKRE